MSKQDCKVFIGGLSWETTDQKLRAYFENHGSVLEAFVSYDRNTGRPRGFGFVVFESAEVADKVVATKHTIDRREVEAKKAVPKEENQAEKSGGENVSQRSRKIFVGGLAPSVDEGILKQYFEQFGAVEDAVVMYDHDNKRPRGFGFITFSSIESVDKVFSLGAMQSLHDKHMEIKPAVPRDEMPSVRRSVSLQGARGGLGSRAPSYAYRQQAYQQQGYGYGRSYGIAGPSGRQVVTGSLQQPGPYRASTSQVRPAGPSIAGQFPSAAPVFPQRVPDYYANFPMAGEGGKYGSFPGGYGVQGLSAEDTAHIASQSSAHQDPNVYGFGTVPQPGNGYPSPLAGVGGRLSTIADVKGFQDIGSNLGASPFAAFGPSQPAGFGSLQPQQAIYPGTAEGTDFLGAEPGFADTVALTGSAALQSTSEYSTFRDPNFSSETNPRWPS